MPAEISGDFGNMKIEDETNNDLPSGYVKIAIENGRL